jgi:hypothetical protein
MGIDMENNEDTGIAGHIDGRMAQAGTAEALVEEAAEKTPLGRIITFTASKKELEYCDYNSAEYRLFTFNFLGECEMKDKDDIRMITLIGESDIGFPS